LCLLVIFAQLTSLRSDAVLVDATLNSMSTLIRTRPHIANKFQSPEASQFPHDAKASCYGQVYGKDDKIIAYSHPQEVRVLSVPKYNGTNKLRDLRHPLAPRIEEYIVRNMRIKSNIFDEPSRKRGLAEPTDGLDAAKRQKIGAQVPVVVPKFHVPPLKPGPHTIAELYTEGFRCRSTVRGFSS